MSVAGIMASNFFTNATSQIAQKTGNQSGQSSKTGKTAVPSFAAAQQNASTQSAATSATSSLAASITHLGQDLKSGDLSAARTDFSSLLHGGLHISPVLSKSSPISSSGAAASSSQSSGNLSADPLAAAWQAYSALQQNPLNSSLSNSVLGNSGALNIDI